MKKCLKKQSVTLLLGSYFLVASCPAFAMNHSLTWTRKNLNAQGACMPISTTISPFWTVFSIFANMFATTTNHGVAGEEEIDLDNVEKIMENDLKDVYVCGPSFKENSLENNQKDQAENEND